MKKAIIICIFMLLILATIIVTIGAARESYIYDMESGVDILEGFGAAIIMGLGGLAVLYELDLFYTVYYFFVKRKTVAKSILVILSHIMLLVVFFSGYIADFLYEYVSDIFAEEIIVLIPLFYVYFILKVVCFLIGSPEED